MLEFTSASAIFDTLWLDMQHPGFWVSVLQIIWIDILLAGDNAVVIALACRNLPPHLRFWGMALGAGVAVLMRILFTLVVSTLMNLPLLKLIGGLALIFIAVKLLLPEGTEEEKEIHSSDKLWQAIKIVALADIVMSLDNVIAIAATANGNAALYIFGLAASIPLIVAGAAIVMSMLTRFPLLVWAGAGLLGWIAGGLVVSDPVLHGWIEQTLSAEIRHSMHYIGAVAGALLVITISWYLRRRIHGSSPA